MRTFRSILASLKSLIRVGFHFTEYQKLLIENTRRALLSDEKYNDKKLNKYEMKILSQNGEDGIIAEIFRRIGSESKIFVEIGSGDGSENNTAYLLLQNWSGIWIESNHKAVKKIIKRYDKLIEDKRLQVIRSKVTTENISDLLGTIQIPDGIDLLSVDIDRNTYWIWAALSHIKSRVVVVEYNAFYPPDIEWIIDYDPSAIWDGTANFGASLKAYENLGKKLGYKLVGCDLTGVNAFFVRDDLCGDYFDEPFTSEHHYEPPRYFMSLPELMQAHEVTKLI